MMNKLSFLEKLKFHLSRTGLKLPRVGISVLPKRYGLNYCNQKFFSSNNENTNEEFEISNIDKVETKITPFQEKPIENKENEESTLKEEGMPFIQYTHPILPFTKIVNKNFNRKELLFNLALKYGKITQIDEETTQIDDIVLYFDKEEKKLGKDESFNYGILCQIRVKKNHNTFVVEGLDKILQVRSTIGFGKYRFFKPQHASEITPLYYLSEEYFSKTLSYVENINRRLHFIKEILRQEEETFGPLNIQFTYDLSELKEFTQKFKEKISSCKEQENKEIILQEYFKDLYKYLSFYLMKINYLKLNFYQTEFDFNKYFQTREVLDKLENISAEVTGFSEFLELKYKRYGFKFNYHLNFENPFVKNTEEDLKRLAKYKLALEHKIKDVDNIEKVKEDFRVRIKKINNMSKEIKAVLETEVNKISGVNFDMENTKRIDYVNHALNLPWDTMDDVNWNIEYTKEILDKHMYGLNETKNRIYEFMAKNQRNDNKKGCVILLHGGPGTGKTRIAKLIGEAMQRKVGFISLAGESDSKNLLGHKRVYVNSCPGVFIKEMQKLGTKNPVIVLDEIDKVLSAGNRSSVFFALLQILNPEESNKFVDHYLEIPFDFSNVIFILTSNNSGSIFPALIDRMEVFEIDPYIDKEKFYIAKNYMVDQIITEFDFNTKNFKINDETLHFLIDYYCKYESGVRRLKKMVEGIVRKVCYQLENNDIRGLVKDNLLLRTDKTQIDVNTIDNNSLETLKNKSSETSELTINITPQNVVNLIKLPNPSDEVLAEYIRTDNLIGTAVGLTVSSSSQSNSFGDAIKISLMVRKTNEINEKKVLKSNKPSSFKFSTSGKIKDVFKQSLEIALTIASKHLSAIDYKKYKNFFIKNEIHFHIPDMLVAKDGPSAGIALYLCAMSIALNKPIRNNLALTGEISFDGSVLKIGGVRQKCQGALRYNIKHIILPMGNKEDFEKLPLDIKDSFENVYFVNRYIEVFNIAFENNDANISRYERTEDLNLSPEPMFKL